jgi:hypothetical protein
MTDCEPNARNNLANATANLLDGIAGTIFTLGDHDDPILGMDCYDATWGRHLARTQPVAGDADYVAPGAAGYYEYFGAAASPHESSCGSDCKGYYSYNLGAWHIVALNSELTDEAMITEQLRWLRDDLAANPHQCTLAYWSRPLFTSGLQAGANLDVQPFWDTLYHYGADVVLSGGDRHYERFAPQNPDGQADPTRGIRQFVVGTGGDTLGTMLITPEPNSEVRHNAVHGLLKLTLHPTSYDWEFISIAGQAFTDTGTTDCNRARPTLPAPIGYWRMQTFFEGLVLNSATEDVDARIVGNLPFENNLPDNNIGWNELESFNRNQQSAKFGAANGHLEVASNSAYNLSDQVTLAAWVNLADPSADQKIVGKLWLDFPNGGGTIGNGYLLGVANGQIQAEVYDANQQKIEAKGGTVPTTTWTHIAMTWQRNGQLIAYLNGAQVITATAGASPIGNNCEAGKGGCNVIIGTAPWDPAFFTANGNIDEVLIFNQALSPDAIAQLAQRTFMVADASDSTTPCFDNSCSLRAAIAGANAGPNGALRDRIHFALPEPAIIQPNNPLPNVTDAVVIDGLTQPGASCSSWPPTIKVALDGTGLTGSQPGERTGFQILTNSVLVRGLNLRNFSNAALALFTGADRLIECNLIGTNLTGTAAAPNGGGVVIFQGSRDQIIDNLIAGNRRDGISAVSADVNSLLIQGNTIGTNISGTATITNDVGIFLGNSSNNRIGGATEQARNLISGNRSYGIHIAFGGANNTISGNIIGADVSGQVALGNQGMGIFVDGSSHNTIGGKNAGNLIAYNLKAGAVISNSNFFSATNNLIAENRIYRNTIIGIDLGGDGVTANDAGDSDDGPNRRQNFPELRGAISSGGVTTINGTLNSQANTEYLIEFYANQSTDPCQGETFLGFDFVTTDGSGNGNFSTTLSKSVPVGMTIAATASNMTPPFGSPETSEFSACVTIRDNDGPNNSPVVSLSPTLLTVNENAGNATLTVALSPTVNVPITVLFSTSVSSLPLTQVATAGSDFLAATNQSLVIPAGQSTATLPIAIIDDTVVEQNERFRVTLALPTDSIATFANANFTSVVTINDNDNPVSNTPPVANAQTVNLPAGSAQSITLVGTDSENDTLTFRIVTPPTNGNLTGTPPTLTYTPNPGFIGADSFTFVTNDGQVDSTSATVTLQVTATNTPGDKQVYLPLVTR